MQLHVSARGSSVDSITHRIEHMAAAFPWVSMLLLSEFAETLPGSTEQTYSELAARLGLWSVTGSMHERSGDKIDNTCSVINPSGVVIGRYRKIFPFRPYSVGVEAGHEFFVFDVPGAARFGVSIWYDMWFPEHSRTLAAMGAEVLLHPVMTPTIDRDVELALARATAATNQMYVVDVNGVGAGGVGKSLIVGPDGDVLHQAGQNEELIPIELDLDRVTRSRARGLNGLGSEVPEE